MYRWVVFASTVIAIGLMLLSLGAHSGSEYSTAYAQISIEPSDYGFKSQEEMAQFMAQFDFSKKEEVRRFLTHFPVIAY